MKKISWGDVKIPNWKKIEKILEQQRLKNNAWDVRNILSKEAVYNVIYGERSNGKTYGVLLYGLISFFNDNSEMAIVRRMDEDFRGKRGATMFKALQENGVISLLSNGKYHGLKYYSHRWYFTQKNENGDEIMTDTIFAYAFALTSMEHDKSTSYPKINTLLFDEFLTRSYYIPDEFVVFMNVISTIKRKRKNLKIFMCGNTINAYSPYFKEMGLTNVKKQKKGTIDLYRYGETHLTCAVEFSDSPAKNKESDYYFAFNNPKLKMITDGEWEIDIYPHLPIKYKPKNIIYQYFVKFEDEILHCEIIHTRDEEHKCEVLFTYIHRKTTEIKDDNTYLVFQQDADARANYRIRLTKPVTPLEKKIYSFFVKEKVFYQDNECGEVMNNYIKWCLTN